MIVYVEQDIYDRLNERLKDMPEKMPDTLKKTINSTAKDARKSLERNIKKEYALRAAIRRVKESTSVESATSKFPQATIVVKGHPIPLYDFQRRKNGKRVAAKAKVLSGSSLKELKLQGGEDNGKDLKAFINTVTYRDKNGNEKKHTGIFQRLTASERGTGSRNKIKQLYGPPIPEMAGSQKVLLAVTGEITDRMKENLEKHIAAVMEGL